MIAVRENRGDPSSGLLLIPTPNVPYRREVTGMVVVCDNAQGKLVYAKPESLWPAMRLSDVGDVDLPETIPEGSCLQYIDGRWTARRSVGENEVQVALEDGLLGSDPKLVIRGDTLVVDGGVTDGLFRMDKGMLVVESLRFAPKRGQRSRGVVDIKGARQGSVKVTAGPTEHFVLVLKNIPKNYSLSLATLMDPSPWYAVEMSDNEIHLYANEVHGPRTFRVAYIFI